MVDLQHKRSSTSIFSSTSFGFPHQKKTQTAQSKVTHTNDGTTKAHKMDKSFVDPQVRIFWAAQRAKKIPKIREVEKRGKRKKARVE